MHSLTKILQNRSPGFYLILMVPMILTCCFYQYGALRTNTELLFHSNSEYLIYTPQCQLPNVDPWSSEAKRFYKKHSYVSCSSQALLSRIVLSKNKTVATLVIDKGMIPKYSKDGVTCCVSDVNRGSGKDIDNKIKYSKCRPIKDYTAIISSDLPTRVTCQSKKKKKEVYKNVHMPIAITPPILEKQRRFNSSARPLSVVIIGIDSISRLNMIRTMPKTRDALLNDPDWIEYKIYHKIDDNTFPNLMAMLTGFSSSQAYDKCNPKKFAGLNKCNFVWNNYRARNYVTAYAEDSGHISTFNFNKYGFNDTPTDYYMRAYQLACNDLSKKSVDGMRYCTGPEMDAERVWRLAKDFLQVYKEHPYFGFFWMNSFSHQELNSPTRQDSRVHEHMLEINATAYENAVVIFLSDHGLRFGKIRTTFTGYLEERLPFFFVRFPRWFQERFPEEYRNIQLNRERLVTPYDLYMTLQEILQLSGFANPVRPAEGCPNCHSLFAPVDINRSCEYVNITAHWCTCLNYHHDDADGALAQQAGHLLLDQVQQIIDERNATGKCVRYQMGRVAHVYRSMCYDGSFTCPEHFMIVSIETKPQVIFEATVKVRWLAKPHLDSTGALQTQSVDMQMYTGISRLDSYHHTGRCTHDSYLKLLCYCK